VSAFNCLIKQNECKAGQKQHGCARKYSSDPYSMLTQCLVNIHSMLSSLAGYDQQVDELMAVNPGLKSRFSEKLCFPDFSVDDACSLLVKRISKDGLQLHPTAEAALPKLMEKVVARCKHTDSPDGAQLGITHLMGLS